jgi:hypothetical protein
MYTTKLYKEAPDYDRRISRVSMGGGGHDVIVIVARWYESIPHGGVGVA